jgi:hypothetical protein
MGMSVTLPPTMRTPSIFGKSFSFGEEQTRPTCVMALHPHVA